MAVSTMVGTMAESSSLSITQPERDLAIIANHIREGRFQRSLALLTERGADANNAEERIQQIRLLEKRG